MIISLKDTGLEAHHIIEQRFATVLGIEDSNLMRSIAVTPEQHQLFTNAWRTAIGYVNSKGEWITTNVSKMRVYNNALEIYKDFPEIIEIIERAIEVNSK